MRKIIRLLKRWINMLLGKSTFHVEQGKGKCYSLTEIKGYYNDLTNKVNNETVLDKNGIPVNTTVAGIETYFPISIFQYGLGLNDLYLLQDSSEYKEKFLNIAKWAINNQEKNGMWDCMGKLNDRAHETQSAMCQSEGVSVLLRAYNLTKDNKYKSSAKKAIEIMTKDIKDGGTCLYENDKVIFQEYVSEYNLSVLNGWIFSIFGLYDYVLFTGEAKYKDILDKTVDCLARSLNTYDRKYWSNYDLKGTIASPSYHDLHIKQLLLMHEMFGNKEFLDYANKWSKYQESKINKIKAMLVKLKQKVFKSKYYDINTSLVK